MRNKGKAPNAMLAKRDAEKESIYRQRLDLNTEIDRIALMKTVNEELKVGPGRADKVFDAFMENRMEVASMILEDFGPDKKTGDKEILYTKKTIAQRMRAIFGPENWAKYRQFFTLLREYWEG